MKVFPQADDISKLFLFFVELENTNFDLKKSSKELVMTSRGISYYLTALIFIGVIKKENDLYKLTDNGKSLLNTNKGDSKLRFLKMVLNCKDLEKFRIYYFELMYEREYLEKKFADVIIEDFNLSETTAKRRAKTILSWYDYINEILGDY